MVGTWFRKSSDKKVKDTDHTEKGVAASYLSFFHACCTIASSPPSIPNPFSFFYCFSPFIKHYSLYTSINPPKSKPPLQLFIPKSLVWENYCIVRDYKIIFFFIFMECLHLRKIEETPYDRCFHPNYLEIIWVIIHEFDGLS